MIDFNAATQQALEDRTRKHREYSEKIADAIDAYVAAFDDDVAADARENVEKQLHVSPGTATVVNGLYAALVERKRRAEDRTPDAFQRVEIASDIASGMLSLAVTKEAQTATQDKSDEEWREATTHLSFQALAATTLSIVDYIGGIETLYKRDRTYDVDALLRRAIVETVSLAAHAAEERNPIDRINRVMNGREGRDPPGVFGEMFRFVWRRYYAGR